MRTGKLTERKVLCFNKRGYANDGGGLYLRVAKGGSKQWVFRFAADGRLREMGLGSIETLTLAEVREKARECRKLRLNGIDPIEQRRSLRAAQRTGIVRMMTFQQCAEGYIAAHRDSWKSGEHEEQWAGSLAAYAYPVFGGAAVADIDLDLVMKVLEPLWKSKTVTASRLRGRIENILDWATVRRFRNGENPARWRGHLDQLLPQPGKLRKVEHHPALPYVEIGAFMTALRQVEGTVARALEFAILTGTRTNEVIGTRWEEIDFAERVWTIPAERMKSEREHRVPLSERALVILRERQQVQESNFVFAGRVGRLAKSSLEAAAAHGPRRSDGARLPL